MNKKRDSFELRLQKSFLFRAQAVFFGRMAISCFYALLFILSLAKDDLAFPHTWGDAIIIFVSFIYTPICYGLKGHRRLGRWVHFITLIFDLILHMILTRQSGLILSPLMAIHPLFTAMFLLLFHNPLLIATSLITIPFHTLLTLWMLKTHSFFAIMYALLLYCTLDALIIFFIHLVQSQEQRLMKSLVAMEKKLRILALSQERSRIARDFHDGIGAQLTSIVMQCDYLALEFSSQRISNEFVDIRESAILSMEDMRRSIALLYDDFDIAEQLARLCESMRERHRLNVETRGIHFLSCLAIEQQIACCRIVQESLTNALKHAQASIIEVFASRDENIVSLTIRDNGLGFDTAAPKRHHYGLGNMHDRAKHIGANLVISSTPRYGTEVTLSIVHGGF